jgi:hypothetical protein
MQKSVAWLWDVHTKWTAAKSWLSGRNETKHAADTLRNVFSSCHSVRDTRNLSHVCYGVTGASLTARSSGEAESAHVNKKTVHS